MNDMYKKPRTAKPVNKDMEVKQGGKYNVIKINNKDIVFPTLEYVDQLSNEVRQLKYINEELKNTNNNLKILNNNLEKRISNIETKLK